MSSVPTQSKRSNAGARLPALVFTDGTITTLKCVALVLMTLDHINKYLLQSAVPAFFWVGRLCLPLFTFVLAYNLARPSSIATADKTYSRTARRLVTFGLVAQLVFVMPHGLPGPVASGWWPLNILFTLALATTTMRLLLGSAWRKLCAALLVLVGGAFVEYWWPALGMCIGAWYYCRRPSWSALAAWLVSTLALGADMWAFAAMPIVNSSILALLAIPAIFWSRHLELATTIRGKWWFYAYYPLHLAALWGIAQAIK
jgi:hypothetical protein